MSPARFARAGEILADCLEREPAERAAFIEEATAGDAELEALVRELLRASTVQESFLDGGVPGEQARQIAEALIDSTPSSGIGDREADRVDGYEIVEALGDGGFGTVWLARQLEPVRRDVALKILKPGLDTREIVARFEQERQSVARMSHENVARVLDAGVSVSGRPFFAMELVRGLTITEHCDAQRLGVRARLKLFVEACRGVQHAHQRGLIHRDIKPSNVLVSDENGRAIPKVIDFGIAKAIEGDADDRLVRTRHGEVLGTPAYMSPEQATPGAASDTRTDVYSLGVLLYELLTGLLPFDGEMAMKRARLGANHPSLRDVVPPRLSERIRSLPKDTVDRRDRATLPGVGGDAVDVQDLQDIARLRATEPHALAREIRGDLDWIVMTAMATEPDRRYPSVDALVADVERHLEHAPVLARPPSAIYRLGKLARRHRLGVAVAGGALALLVVGVASTAYSLAIANRERAIAEERRVHAEEQAYGGAMLLAEQAIRSRRLDAARALLDSAPKDLRGWEWYHLIGRLGSDVSVVVHRSSTFDAIFRSRDGSRCWTWDRSKLDSWDGSGRDMGPGVEIPGWAGGWFFEGADGTILAVNDERLVRVRVDGRSPAVVELPSLGNAIDGAVVDASSGRLFWSDPSGVLLSRAVDGGPIRRGPKLPSANRNRLVTRDGAWLIDMGHHDLEVIDAASLTIVHATAWPASKELSKAALSPDDTLLAMAYSDGTVELHEFRPSGLTLRSTLPSDPSWVCDLSFSQDGRYLAAGHGGGTVRTWEVASGELQDALALAGDPVGKVAFLGSRLLMAPWDRGLLSWRPGADEHRRMRGHASYVYGVALLDGGALAVSGGWDSRSGGSGALKWWDVSSRRLVGSWGSGKELVFAVAPSADGKRVWVATQDFPDGRVRCFDVATGEVTASFAFSGKQVVNVVSLDARRGVALTGDRIGGGEVFLLDLQDGSTRPLPNAGLTGGGAENDRAVAMSRDGRWLALSWGRGGIQILDARTLERLARREAHASSTWSVTFSADGERLVSSSDDGTVAIWTVPSLEPVQRLRGSGSPVLCVAWSPDGTRIAAGARDGGIELWDPVRGMLVGKLTGHASYVKSVAWSPDGRTLLSASGDHDIRVWDSTSVEEVADAVTERETMLADLEPVIASRLSETKDAGEVARWIDEGSGMTPRQRQIARQVLLRHGLERSHDERQP